MVNDNKVIWPVSIRMIHWIIAVIVLLDAFVLEEGDPPHRYLGYASLVAVGVRLYYGVFGKGHLLFSSFPLRASDFKTFFRTHFSGSHDYVGHNPAASFVYIIMWLLIIALGVTGWMMGLDRYWGEEWLVNLHEQFSDALVVLVVLHIVGILVDAIIYKRKTWMGMIKGSKYF